MFATVVKHSFLQIWDHVVLIFCGNFAVTTAALLLALAMEHSASSRPGVVFAVVVAGTFAMIWLLLVYAAFLHHLLTGRTGRFRLGSTAARLAPGAALGGSTLIGCAALTWLAAGSVTMQTGMPGGLTIALAAWMVFVVVQCVCLYTVLAAMGEPFDRSLRITAAAVFARPGLSLAVLGLALLAMLSTIVLLPGPGGALVIVRNLLNLHLRADRAPAGTPWDDILAEERALHQRLDARALLFPWRR